jgi:hypothetical protein
MSSIPIRKLRIQLMAAMAVVVAMIWAAVAYQLGRDYDAALRTAQQQGQNLSRVVADHFSAYGETFDVLLRRLRIQWLVDPSHFAQGVALSREIRREGLRKEAFPVRIAVIDARGRLVYSSGTAPPPGAMDYFTAHKNRPVDELRIDNPETDATTGKSLIYFTRPILDGRGGFAGVLLLVVSTESLGRVYEGLQLGPQSLVALRRLDDTLFLRWPDTGGRGRKLRAVSTEAAQSAIRKSGVDGVVRVFTFQRWSVRRSMRFSRNTTARSGSTSRREASSPSWSCGSGWCCSPS